MNEADHAEKADHLVRAGGAVNSTAEVELPHDRDVVVGGIRLHYLDWGRPDGMPILFLHGGGLNAHTWDVVCADLRRDNHCYAIDLRGHGDSEWSPTLEYGLDAHVRDLEGFVDNLGAKRVVLVGHSLGGHAAIRYASQHPGRIAALVVVDTSPFFRGGPPLKRIRDFMVGADQFDSFEDAIEYVCAYDPSRDPTKLGHTLKHSLRQLPDGRWTWKRDQRHLNERYFAEALKELQSLVPLLDDIACPTLIVRGEKGITAEDAEKFRSRVLQSRGVTIEGARHNVQTDNAPGLVVALRSFLADVTRQAHELGVGRK